MGECQNITRSFARAALLSPDIGELPMSDVLHIAHEVLPFEQYDYLVMLYSFSILKCLEEEG